MQKEKIGTIFFVAILALAGVGITYAGWTDTIEVTGTVNTGTVTWEPVQYSGTWVWKEIANHGRIIHYNQPIELHGDGIADDDPSGFYTSDPADDTDGDGVDDRWELVARSWAQEGTGDYDVEVYYENLYPLVPFEADFKIKYTGSVPGRINEIIVSKSQEWEDYFDDHAVIEVYDDEDNLIPVEQLPGYQLHQGDIIHVVMTITIPQDNNYMLRSGVFGMDVIVVQWNEYPYDYSGECGGDSDLSITKTVDEDNPCIGTDITYTLTATNNGPDDASNVVVHDPLPGDLVFVSCDPAGAYDPVTGDWFIGALANGASESLTITATVADQGSLAAKTQMCMIIDGSGSISPTEWGIMLNGISTAVSDPTIFPHDSTVELTIIQFAANINGYARVEIGPVVITDTNYGTIATQILGITQAGGTTPLYAGIDLAKTTVEGSSNHPNNQGDFSRQVFNIVTDGSPNVGSPNGYDAAEASRDILVATLNDGEDELDAEGVGITTSNRDWLRDEIVWPEPGYIAPPFDQGAGWVRVVANYTEFANTIGEKFSLVLQSIINCATIESSDDDPNLQDNTACVTVYPQLCDLVGTS